MLLPDLIIDKYGDLTAVSDETGLSREQIIEEVKGMGVLIEARKRAFDAVMTSLHRSALGGDVQAARLWLECHRTVAPIDDRAIDSATVASADDWEKIRENV